MVNHALAWERRSKATFKGEKTALIYFIRNIKKQSTTLINIKGVDVAPRDKIKVLDIILDLALRFKNHIKNALIKGLKAVLALRQIRALTLVSARQLFIIMVTLIMDYALNACTGPGNN